MKSMVVEDAERGTFRVDRHAFTDQQVFELEIARVFERSWVYVGHESEVPNCGDYCTRDVAGRPIVFLRDSAGVVRVLLNTCTHRGALVCLEKCGNGKSFQCPYHGWTFDQAGELIGVPGEDAYKGGLRREAFALGRPPRFESYRGFAFMSLSPTAAPLESYLGRTTEYIDLICDQSESGFAVVEGVHQYEVRANWKLLVENSIDIYHLPTVHKRFVEFVRRDQDKTVRPTQSGLAVDLGNGHAVVENPPTAGRPIALWHPDFGDEQRAEVEAVRAKLEARFGRAHADRMTTTNRNLLIFPNLAIIDAAGIVIRTFFPVAPDRMKVTSWCFAPKSESPGLRRARMRNYLMFLGPGGFGTPDDCAIIESCQKGFVNREIGWSDMSRGIERAVPRHTDEAQMRAFWRRWDALLGGSE